MDIIVQQVLGGFRARFRNDRRFSKRGSSKAEAIGNLALAKRRRLKIGRVQWDRQHAWTRNYLAGKSNRRKTRRRRFDVLMLPNIYSLEEARRLTVHQLGLPNGVGEGLLYAFANIHVTVGEVCQYTRQELRERSSTSIPLGPKRLDLLERVLHHYGLALKG